jgi:hypothetical protein
MNWIPVTERTPPVEAWFFPDRKDPAYGLRESMPVPVLINGKASWANFIEVSEDGGKTVSGTEWTSQDGTADYHRGCEPSHWFELPELKKAAA